MAPATTSRFATASIAALMAFSGTDAFAPPQSHTIGAERASSSSLFMQPPKGCAAKAYEKKKIAVFGAGGYLGANVFGFLQRAAALYGTGISGSSSPRAICATNAGSEALNKVLGPGFKLAYAGEDLIRLVDNSDKDYIKERVKGFDAAILGTTYQLEQRPVTMGTYETNVNSKAYEMYLDEKYGAWEVNIPSNDDSIHTTIFKNSVQACKEAGMSHLVVLETPKTENPIDFLNILKEEGIAYTYVRTACPMVKDKFYTFEKGISNNLQVSSLSAGSELTQKSENNPPILRTDMAALMVQSLMSLDWAESRILEVSPSPDSTISTEYGAMRSKQTFHKEWCPNSELLAETLSAL